MTRTFNDVPEDPSLAELPENPLTLLNRWLDEARDGKVARDPLAMCLATVDTRGGPAQRMVMCRGFDHDGGYLVFFTDAHSRKARDLAAIPRASALFHWGALARQVRIDGRICASPVAESDAWFTHRHRALQISAYASEQSAPAASRRTFLDALVKTEQRFDGVEPIPRPENWGGYRLWIERVEFWVGAEGRGHDRALCERDLTETDSGFCGGPWRSTRLQP